MKKTFALITAAVLLISTLTSCGNDTPASSNNSDNLSITQPSTPSYDKFVYRLESGKLDWNYIGMPLKVNLTSGKTTTACIDPLCMHDTEDCPFFDCTGSVIDGEIMFFGRGWLTRGENGYSGTTKLCTYHVATGEIRVLDEYSDSLVFLGAWDDTLYYYTAEWAKEGNDLVCTYHLCRADGKSGKVTELNLPEVYRTVGGFTDNSDYPNILMIAGDTIYWYKYDEDMTAAFYTSDRDAEGWTELEKGVKTFANIYHGGYGYSVGAVMELINPEGGMTKENLTSTYYLVRRKIGENEPERIAENIGSSNFIVTDRYIFTMEGMNEVPDGISVKSDAYSFGSSAGKEILSGCRIWRMNHDGSERVMVAESADYYFAGHQYKHDEVMFGYYEDEESTYLAMFFMEEDENGKLTLSENTLILNTATGEFTVSEYIG